MALTRKALKAMGLTDEQVDSIIEMHVETTDGLKADVAKYKADADKLPGVQKELNELKAAGDGGYKEKYEKEHKAFEDFKKDINAKETRSAKEKAYREILKNAGVAEKYIEDVMGVAKLDDLELVDGKFKDADNLTNTVKEKYGAFIPKTTTSGATVNNPPTNNPGAALKREDILKIKDTTERQRAWAAYISTQKGE